MARDMSSRVTAGPELVQGPSPLSTLLGRQAEFTPQEFQRRLYQMIILPRIANPVARDRVHLSLITLAPVPHQILREKGWG